VAPSREEPAEDRAHRTGTGDDEAHASSVPADLALARLDEGRAQLVVGRRDGVLRELGDDVRGRTEQDAAVRFAEHARVVVGVARGDDVEVQVPERADRAPLAVVDPQSVADDAILAVDLERVAEQAGVAELAHQGSGELVERVGEDDDLRAVAQPAEEPCRSGHRPHSLDDALDLAEGDALLVEDAEAVAHELVVVGLVARRPAERFDAGALGDVDPDLRNEDAFEIEAGDHARTLAEACRGDNRRALRRAAAATFALLALGFAACATAPLRVGTSGDYAPFSTRDRDGAPVGFDIDVARAYAGDRGRKVEIVPFRWPDLEAKLLAKEFDVAMGGVTVRGDRLAQAPMTAAVARAEAIVVVPASTKLSSLDDVDRAGRTVVVNRGGHLEKVARAHIQRATLRTVDDNESLRRLLASGEIDAVVTDSVEVRTFPETPRVVAILTRDRKAYWVAPGDEDLAGDLDAWLAERESDGTLAASRARWLGSPENGTLPAGEARVVDLLARRLLLMPYVAEAKRRASLPVEDREREIEIECSARKTARRVGLAPEPYAALVHANIGAAKAVQRAVLADPSAASAPSFDLGTDLRPAIDRIDRALRVELVRTAPLRSPSADLLRALQEQASVPGLDARTLAIVVVALQRIPAAK